MSILLSKSSSVLFVNLVTLAFVVNASTSAVAQNARTASSTSVVRPGLSAAEVDSESQRVKANLEMWPQRVRSRLAEAEQRLKGLDFEKIKAQKMFAQDFLSVLDDLDEEARAIEGAFSNVTSDFRLWQDAVTAAPASFRNVAAELDKKASAADDLLLKAHYADFAAMARSLAAKYEAKGKSLSKLEGDIQQKLAFVRKSRDFTADVRKFVTIIPATEEGLEVERFIERLNTYVDVFQESIKMLKGLAEEVAQEPKPAAKAGTSTPASSGKVGASAQPAASLTPESYRDSVLALKRNR